MTLHTMLIHPAVRSLGWALLHFLWQGALLSALFVGVDLITRRSQARLRYAIGCVAMLLMPAVFTATVFRNYPSPAVVSFAQNSPVVFAPAEGTQPLDSVSRSVDPDRRPSVFAPDITVPAVAVGLWLTGILALSFATAVGSVRVRRLRRRGLKPFDAAWADALDGLTRRLAISRPVRLYASAIAEVPVVIGWIRPYVLFPVSALTGLSDKQLRAVLAHELAHIRRHDYLVNLLQTAVETLFFYHPAVWWLSRRVRQEREHCCDDLAVAVCGDVMVYAGALVQLEQLRAGATEPALAATGGDLLARIRRLVGQGGENRDRTPSPIGATMAVTLVLCAIAAGHAPAIRAQDANAAPPKFEVASVKACKVEPDTGGQRRREYTVSPGRAEMTCLTVERLIYFAYAGIGSLDHPLLNDDPQNDTHIRGGPGWIRSDKYSIDAKAEGTPSRTEMMGPMLRALLEERFQLKSHREQEEVPMLALTVAKGGLKMQPLADGGCTSSEAAQDLSREAILALNTGPKPICGNFTSTGDGVNKRWSLGGTSLEHFARSPLSDVLDHHVIDKTGVAGLFNIRLEFALDESIRPNIFGGGRPQDPPPPGIEKGSSIFAALEQQLGLKLEKTKGPRQYLVIDHVERPSEN